MADRIENVKIEFSGTLFDEMVALAMMSKEVDPTSPFNTDKTPADFIKTLAIIGKIYTEKTVRGT